VPLEEIHLDPRLAITFQACTKKHNNNGVPGAAAGSNFEIPAPSLDTLRGGRKGDP
jgi:hypothetical protein